MNHALRNAGFEWHDLPVGRLSLCSTGIEIELLPFDEAQETYVGYLFQLTDAESITLNVSGVLTAGDLEGLEVASLEFEPNADEQISGKLGFIPGSPSVGYWELGFKKARWRLSKHNSSFNPDALTRAG